MLAPCLEAGMVVQELWLKCVFQSRLIIAQCMHKMHHPCHVQGLDILLQFPRAMSSLLYKQLHKVALDSKQLHKIALGPKTSMKACVVLVLTR